MEQEKTIQLGSCIISSRHPPLIIAEIGINHEGDFKKAKKMVKDASEAGCKCVKFQCHIIDDEMTHEAKKVIPGNASESIWNIIQRCSFSEEQDRALKKYVEDCGMLYLSTPFSRAAADRLQRMKVSAFKIGSGECNNYPLIKHIAAFKKPIILSTGMNDMSTILPAVQIIRGARLPFALLHCTSIYPTPHELVRLPAINQLKLAFPDAIVGFSDHTEGTLAALGAVANGACIIEKHFTSDKTWPGPDMQISMTPEELSSLISDSVELHKCLSGGKTILEKEKSCINFAYASVVSLKPIKKGEILSEKNIWVKRPGTGDFLAKDYEALIGRYARIDIPSNVQLKEAWVKI